MAVEMQPTCLGGGDREIMAWEGSAFTSANHEDQRPRPVTTSGESTEREPKASSNSLFSEASHTDTNKTTDAPTYSFTSQFLSCPEELLLAPTTTPTAAAADELVLLLTKPSAPPPAPPATLKVTTKSFPQPEEEEEFNQRVNARTFSTFQLQQRILRESLFQTNGASSALQMPQQQPVLWESSALDYCSHPEDPFSLDDHRVGILDAASRLSSVITPNPQQCELTTTYGGTMEDQCFLPDQQVVHLAQFVGWHDNDEWGSTNYGVVVGTSQMSQPQQQTDDDDEHSYLSSISAIGSDNML